MNPSQAGLRMTLAQSPREQDLGTLEQRLEELGAARGMSRGRATLAIFLRDPDGDVVGGAYGTVEWQMLHLQVLWVSEGLRGFGYGTRLLQQLERVALERGCRQVTMRGLSFQALEFLTQRGYQEFLRLQGIPVGHDCVFLRKSLGVGATRVTSPGVSVPAVAPEKVAGEVSSAASAGLEKGLAKGHAGAAASPKPGPAPVGREAAKPAKEPPAPGSSQTAAPPGPSATKTGKEKVSCAPVETVAEPAMKTVRQILEELPDTATWGEIRARIRAAQPSPAEAAEQDMEGIRTCLEESEPYLVELNQSVEEMNRDFAAMNRLLAGADLPPEASGQPCP